MNFKFIVLLITLTTLALSPKLHSEQLSIFLMPVDGVQREAYSKIIDQFGEKHPNIEVEIRTAEHEYYKHNIDQLLIKTHKKSDVYFWFGGLRLKQLATADALLPLTQVWSRNNWNSYFSETSRSAVSFNSQVYALPIYYYQWGFYYSKSLFKQLNLAPPLTWADFINVSNKLSKNKITPILLASSDLWPNASWFDYLNLRINGLEFHKQLLAGAISFESSKVTSVFKHWKQLIDTQAFTANHGELDWKSTLPRIYHKKEGMLLMGNFLIAHVSQAIRDDLGFFPFPTINKTVPRFEEAPLDTLIVPKNVKNKKEAILFLEFMANPTIQSQIAKDLYMIPANIQAKRSHDEFIEAGYQLINSAKGTSQFFDRDSNSEFSEAAMSALVSFHTHRDISRVQAELEQLRLRFH